MLRRLAIPCFFSLVVTFTIVSILPVRAQGSQRLPSTQRALMQQKKVLETRLTDAQLKYTSSYPLVKSLQRQLEDINRHLSHPSNGTTMRLAHERPSSRKSAALKAQLADAQLKYTQDHPVVKSLQAQLEALDHTK